MRDMLELAVLPWLEARFGRRPNVATHAFYLLGLAESAFGERAGEWMARGANPLMGVTAHQGVLKATLRARGEDLAIARAMLDARCAEFRERFAVETFSESDPRPAFAVGRALIERGIELALAESCTGGLVAAQLTEVPGISAVFRSGWVVYANATKERELGVERALLERHGAVSPQVAEALARGAAQTSGARIALAITGVAGPDGGSAEKPVGLVWFGLAVDGRVTTHEQRYPPVGRATIRQFAANTAFDLVRRHIPAH
jgi:nicotinamide-nucleotide amidase